jgi:endonuclease G
MQLAYARQAVPVAVRNLIFDPNVTTIGIGWPEHKGVMDESMLAIRFHVRTKYEPGFQLESAIERRETGQSIPKEINGVPTDVIESQYCLHQAWNRWWNTPWAAAPPRAKRCNPLHGGVGISSERVHSPGTLGGLVRDRRTGRLMCLSNWHVLVGFWTVRPPQRIFQPGRSEGATVNDTFAILDRDAMMDNLDAAVAYLVGERTLVNDQMNLGPVTGISRAEPGMVVEKSGYKSEITHGWVTEIHTTAKMSYDRQTRLIRDVFVIDNLGGQVSCGGDSGSLWLDSGNKHAVGLHFAGTDRPEQALAMDIQAVLDALEVDLVTG